MVNKVDCFLVLDLGSLGTKAIATKLDGSSQPVAFFVEYPETDSISSEIISEIMTAVWMAGRELGLGNRFSMGLSILLSVPEMRKDIDCFFDQLHLKCKDFNCPTGDMSVEIVFIDVEGLPLTKAYVEGTGVAFEVRIGDFENIKSMTVPIVNMGFRNISIILMQAGSVDEEFNCSCPLGMVDLLNRIDPSNRYHRCSLAKAVFDIGNGFDILPLVNVISSNSNQDRFVEADSLLDCIKLHREVYARLVGRWVLDSLPQDYDSLVFCGGTADYLRPWLGKEFKDTQILWQGGVKVPSELSCGIGNRMADVYGLYNYTIKVPVKLMLKDDR